MSDYTGMLDMASDTTLARIAGSLDRDLISQLDGTAETYKKIMRQWFIAQGIDIANPDSTELTEACEKWYALTRDTWHGYVDFYQPDVSALSTGTKGGDNADLTCTPSTDTTANTDDYAGLPLFACVDVNWEADATTLEPVITAICGITDNFKRTDPDTLVGVMQMSGWRYWIEGSDTYRIGYSATPDINVADVEPVAEAVRASDNSFRQFVVHAKYNAYVTSDSKMTCCAGVIPTAFVSHNTLHTYSANNGSQYSASTVCDLSWMQLMFFVKYGSLTADGILQGCVNNNYQYYALVAEEGVNRVLVSSAAASYLEVGENMLIGDYSTSTDRLYLYSTSGSGGAKITAIETETVDDTDYCAVYFDDIDAFDTGAEGSATEGTTYISTWHWTTGTTDSVQGNDGSPTDPTSGKYPAKLQGIEYAVGFSEIPGDVILNYYTDDDGNYMVQPYICRLRANQSTSVTANYEATGLTIEQPTSEAWKYIKKVEYADGCTFPTQIGGTSSTYLRDGAYFSAQVTGTREWRAFGNLSHGVANGGLSFLTANNALSSAGWYYGGRISPNGNRGAWSA